MTESQQWTDKFPSFGHITHLVQIYDTGRLAQKKKNYHDGCVFVVVASIKLCLVIKYARNGRVVKKEKWLMGKLWENLNEYF